MAIPNNIWKEVVENYSSSDIIESLNMKVRSIINRMTKAIQEQNSFEMASCMSEMREVDFLLTAWREKIEKDKHV